ncbi:restriction endonuclease subunit S [Vibrio jasicida]|uniref:restriction endonuclease subunit S n=1 Tax=Vibrio jasicida TaxID=766224 RepID=UPI0003A167E2|nr:restriction endonuclease subunit S [Vibrio jasicida]
MSADQSSINQLITNNIDTWTSTVKTKATTGRGSSKKRELYGVKKLRELILELAVRGKLVPQDPNDEPASVLLERIAAQKAQLIKDKKIKKNRKQPVITQEEIYFSAPKSWAYARLEDVYDVRDGTHDSPKPTSEGYPLVTSKNLSSGKLDLSEVKLISKEDHMKVIERSRVDRNDILFAMIGSIGNPVIVDTEIEFSIKNVGLFKYYNPKDSSPNYLNHFLKYAAEIMKKQSAGGVQPFVSLGKLRGFVMPTPPLAEQHRIVAKVNELMTLCDQLEQQAEASIEAHQVLVTTLLDTLTNSADAAELMQNWQMVAEHFDILFTTEESIDQLKQTILQLAVMGKLVPQDPNDESAAKLLERIAEEKAQLIKEKKIKKQKALPPIADDEKPFELPNGWKWAQLGELTASEDNAMCDGPFGSKLKTEHYISDKGYAVIRLGNIGVGKFLWGKEGYISQEHYATLPNNHIQSGDLIIAGMAEPLIRTCEVPPNLGPAVNKADCFRLRMHALIEKKYITHYLNSYVAKQFASEDNRGMTRQRINLSKCKALPVPIPPFAEQVRVVTAVYELFTICDQLKFRLKGIQTTHLHLTDAIVEQAL